VFDSCMMVAEGRVHLLKENMHLMAPPPQPEGMDEAALCTLGIFGFVHIVIRIFDFVHIVKRNFSYTVRMHFLIVSELLANV
jgi:hypothetical protein